MRIGWLILLGGILWKFLVGPGKTLWAHWTDPRFIALLLFAVALIVVGTVKKRRREDKHRARFL